MVAKMAEALDRLSGGRLILGLGGGYSDQEFRAFGLRVPTAREKVDGMAEAIQIAHGLWSEPAFTLDGRHHRTVAAPLEPKPAHHIPIWLGTFGPRALTITGRLADGWIPSLGNAPPEQIPAMRDRSCAAPKMPEGIPAQSGACTTCGSGSVPRRMTLRSFPARCTPSSSGFSASWNSASPVSISPRTGPAVTSRSSDWPPR
jgi:alkanesulfonate monooxygenase SsuD/methylene tetrahydromethanopterin reductase-like flavin-dependent oxidoreductase (luciferase family)